MTDTYIVRQIEALRAIADGSKELVLQTPGADVKGQLEAWATRSVERAFSLGCLEDARTESMGDLFDVLDAIEPGVGTRVFLALYPGADKLLSGTELGRRAA